MSYAVTPVAGLFDFWKSDEEKRQEELEERKAAAGKECYNGPDRGQFDAEGRCVTDERGLYIVPIGTECTYQGQKGWVNGEQLCIVGGSSSLPTDPKTIAIGGAILLGAIWFMSRRS
jgi:hypothetical protein